MARSFRLRGLVLALLSLCTPAHGVIAARHRPAEWPVLAEPTAADRVLIITPHVDDEAIAAAGFVQAARARGAQVDVVYLTAGDNNRTAAEILDRSLFPGAAAYLREGEVRYREALEAMSRLDVASAHVFLLGYPDRGLALMLRNPRQVIRSPGTGKTAVPYREAVSPGADYRLDNLLADLDRVLRSVRPTIVLLPVPFDAHPDHSAGGKIALRAVAASGLAPSLLGYLVHARHFPSPFLSAPARPLNPPRAFRGEDWTAFPLTREQEVRKRLVLQAYGSQRRDPYLLLLTNAFVRRNELFVRLQMPVAMAQEGASHSEGGWP